MNLDEQLRAILSQQAEMRDAGQPDVEGLVRGGRVRRRRRNVARVGVVTAATVLVGAAAYGVIRFDPGSSGPDYGTDVATQPSEPTSTPPSYQDTDQLVLEPGTYRMFVGRDAADVPIEADLTIEGPNWTSGSQPEVSQGASSAGVGVYQPEQLAGGSGCSGDDTLREAGETPQVLARQLTRLPRATVVQPATPTEAFGHDAIHLRLRIDDECPAGQVYRVAEMTRPRSRGITYGDTPKGVLIDFWVLDVDGTAVLVDLWRQVDASTELVGRATQVRDSISFVDRE